jgi:branched-chain amino acid transport system ATP-binding protein
MMLDVAALQSGYGKALAIDGVTFALDTPGSLAVLGRNGAGKSTLIKCIMGLIRPWSGKITFRNTAIGGWPTDRVANAGIGYVPEERRIFESLSVIENLLSGEKPGIGDAPAWTATRIFEMFPEIARRRNAAAGTLSGGERQMLSIARALMGNPQLLLLDEPSEGLAPVVVKRLGEAFRDLRTEGISILIAEQNRRLARTVAEQVIIMETGRVAWCGRFADLDADPDIARRLLGV